MATLAPALDGDSGTDRFFSRIAIAMAVTVVLAFSTHYLAGRSTFAARPLVHLHAVAFMGWVALFTVQAQLGARRETPDLHRRLGWFGAGWIVVLVALGFAMTIDDARRGRVPFFFQPQHFLVINPLTVLGFAALTTAAIRMRGRTDWHRRLHIGAMSLIMGPAFGRLLPLPLLQPWAFDIAAGAGLVFPLVGVVRDQRTSGRIHRAWLWPLTLMPLLLIAARLIAFSPAGDALYHAVTHGAAGESVAGRAFGAPPAAP